MTSLAPPRSRAFMLVVMGLLATRPGGVTFAGPGDEYRRFLKEKSSVLVTIKFVLKMKMGAMGEEESESEITGVMIDPKGLILCSNTRLSGFVGLISRMMGSMGGDISATPTDFKVLIGDEVEGREAELLARDSELDLAWVKLKESADEPFEYLDFGKGVEPSVGQRVVAVRRMGKYFARTAVLADGRISGLTKKPRDLYVPSIDIAMAQGLPVYDADGKVLGFTVVQMPEEEDVEVNPLAMLSRMSNMQDMMMAFILPAAEVAKATRRAVESAKSENP